MFSNPPTVQPDVVSVSWTAAGSSDPLVTGVRYALYRQCGADTTFQLIDDDIQGLSYNITTLPSLNQCALRVVVYGDHCLLNVNSLFRDTTDNFTTGTPIHTSHCHFVCAIHTCSLSFYMHGPHSICCMYSAFIFNNRTDILLAQYHDDSVTIHVNCITNTSQNRKKTQF